MLRHIPFVFILQGMLNRRPEVHSHCTDLYLRLQLLWPFDRIHCIINNQMITSVTTLFNMLQNDLYGARFLDLFAGSGAIGIEALSRGAKEAVFVDKGDGQISCIRDNLKTTHLEERARVMSADVTEAIRKLDREGKAFDFIFMDPPYRMDLPKKVLEALKDTCLADEETLIIVEEALEADFSWVCALGYEIVKSKEYKTNKHVFLRKKEN